MRLWPRIKSGIMPLLIVLAVGFLVLWLFTGGVAIQSVQRFDSAGKSRWSEHEGVKVSLGGSVSHFDIPFLVSRYTEKGPFQLSAAYYNHAEKHFREFRRIDERL
jgi:hypothetical protein